MVFCRGVFFLGLPSADALLLEEAGREGVGEVTVVVGSEMIGFFWEPAALGASVDGFASSTAGVEGAGDAGCLRRTEPRIASGICEKKEPLPAGECEG